MNDTVLFEIREGVGTLTLNRPASLNALSLEMMEALLYRAKELKANAEKLRCIVIAGAGEHFMAGGDIKQFHTMLAGSAHARGPQFRELVERYINPSVAILREHPAPVIARLQGACAGFGFSLMLGADLAIAADNAYFCSAYSQIGMTPDGGGTWFLPRVVGSKKAAEILLLSERISAQQALNLGLINRIVPLSLLDEAVSELTQRLVTGAHAAHAGAKRLLQGAFDSALDAQLQSEAESFGACAATEDFVEGVTAFVEKRKPIFRST